MNTFLKSLLATAPAILAADSLHAQMLAGDPVAKPPATTATQPAPQPPIQVIDFPQIERIAGQRR